VLDEHSAQDIIEIDIRGKSSISDYMIVTSGRSNRHVGALSDYLIKSLKNIGKKNIGIEGLKSCDWVLIDVGDVIVHLFRPEVRAFYNIEKIWSMPSPLNLNEKIQYDPENTEA
jgi:ribosome-associated protein